MVFNKSFKEIYKDLLKFMPYFGTGIFIISLSVFLLLLLKNPFSERNLISNLEPYPDTLHYLNPPLNFVKGNGFYFQREGRVSVPAVPPLYSFVVMPVYFFTNDVRAFYFVNVVLAVLSLWVFYLLVNKITKNYLFVAFALILYVTNYFIYWFPTLAMAENLTLLLFNISLWLIASKVSVKKMAAAVVIAVSFYATKKVGMTLTISLLFIYVAKILGEVARTDIKKHLLIFLQLTVICFVLFFIYEMVMRDNNIFLDIFSLMKPLLNLKPESVIATVPTGKTPWFAFSFFPQNFPLYINALIGKPMRFLWDYTPLVPNYVGLVGIIGLVIGSITTRFRLISLSIAVFLISMIIFISTFYSNDARYINFAIPSLILSMIIALEILSTRLKNKRYRSVYFAIIGIVLLTYCFTNAIRIKNQIVLNLKYTETPWYFLAVKNFNEFFKDSLENKPILITAQPPFYVDFFSNSNYKLLPLSKDQEFQKRMEFVWGEMDYSNLINVYTKYLEEGKDVYVTNSGLGNEGYLYNGFNAIKENFTLTEMKKGCFDTCNIYKLAPKE